MADPAMHWVVGDRTIMGAAASTSQMGRFENLAALTDLPGQWSENVHSARHRQAG